MKRLNGASELWWGQVAENQHCDEAPRRARPTVDDLTQQLKLVQICEATRRCQQDPRLRHETTSAALIGRVILDHGGSVAKGARVSDIGRFLRDFGVLTLTSALKTGQCPPTVDCRCAMGQDFKTLEVADDGCGRLQFDLSLDQLEGTLGARPWWSAVIYTVAGLNPLDTSIGDPRLPTGEWGRTRAGRGTERANTETRATSNSPYRMTQSGAVTKIRF